MHLTVEESNACSIIQYLSLLNASNSKKMLSVCEGRRYSICRSNFKFQKMFSVGERVVGTVFVAANFQIPKKCFQFATERRRKSHTSADMMFYSSVAQLSRRNQVVYI